MLCVVKHYLLLYNLLAIRLIRHIREITIIEDIFHHIPRKNQKVYPEENKIPSSYTLGRRGGATERRALGFGPTTTGGVRQSAAPSPPHSQGPATLVQSCFFNQKLLREWLAPLRAVRAVIAFTFTRYSFRCQMLIH